MSSISAPRGHGRVERRAGSPALAAEGVQFNGLVVAATIPDSQRDAIVKARAFYEIWNTDDEADLKRAILPTFTDHTLPSGRPVASTRPRNSCACYPSPTN
jgi:hypothetical protein